MKTILFLVFTFLSIKSNAQQNESINTDRPDQSDGTYVLPKRAIQLESGLIFTKEAWVHTSMFRYGLLKKLECRLILEEGASRDYISGQNVFGFFPLQLSGKYSIINEKGLIPAITAVGYLKLPKIASKVFQEDQHTIFLLLAFENNLSEKLSIGYNTGIKFNEEEIAKQYVFTTSLAYIISNKVGAFVEYFGSYHTGKPSNNVDAGLLLLFKNNFQLDLAGGTSLSSFSDRYFITVGISYLF